VVREPEAHDFVWRHFLKPWDLCVYELENTRAHQFEWGYLLNYPGIVFLKNPDVENSSGATLSREGRLDDYMTEFRLDDRTQSPLRVPLLASRSVVVAYESLAESLQDNYPDARVRYAPTGVRRIRSRPQNLATTTASGNPARTVFGVLDRGCDDVIDRAVRRAADSGSAIELLRDAAPATILAECDVVIALNWPPHEKPQTAALCAMAAGKPVIAFELDSTADWPALDPQTWRQRGVVPLGTPMAVTIDPRDEVHSLMLGIRRLAVDATLREQLGAAGRRWWEQRATPAHAAVAWMRVLDEAASLTPPPRPADWPKHLGVDGTELADAVLDEFGLSSDL
jgi:hypothetical protein